MSFRQIIPLFLLVLLVASTSAAVAPPGLSVPPETDIDRLMESAISGGLIAGGVVLVGDSNHDLFFKSYGKTSPDPAALPLSRDSLFDIASLTKVVATAPSVMKLTEEGKISLVEPAKNRLPELGAADKKDLLILNLLTHTSGLDDPGWSSTTTISSLLQAAASRRTAGEIGSRFHYADINFILLGEMVRRVTGEGLDRFATENIFLPLGMHDTLFNPSPELARRCATTIADNGPVTGVVQDGLSRQLGGVAGHAGLFSTAHDLGTFCRMMLGEGTYDGVQVLSERTVDWMTAPYFSRGGSVVRGLGWDISSPYSAPRGSGFSGTSFGHTGYSGTSLWIDPEQDLFVVFLTVRLEYHKVHDFNRLRSDLSSIASRFLPLRQLELATSSDRP